MVFPATAPPTILSGNRTADDSFRRPAGAFARLQQQRLDGFHHDRVLQRDEVFRLARGFDARADVVAKTNLLVERAGPRQHFAGDQIHQQHDDGGRADIHGKRRVAPARLRREQRLMRVGHGDLEGLADLRPVFDTGTRRNENGRRSVEPGAAGLDGGGRGNRAAFNQQRAFAQLDFAAATQSALAAAGVQR